MGMEMGARLANLKLNEWLKIIGVLLVIGLAIFGYRMAKEYSKLRNEYVNEQRARISAENGFQNAQELVAKEKELVANIQAQLQERSQAMQEMINNQLAKIEKLNKDLRKQTGQGVSNVGITSTSGEDTATVKCPEAGELDLGLKVEAACLTVDVDEKTGTAIPFYNAEVTNKKTGEILLNSKGEGNPADYFKAVNVDYKPPDPIYKKLNWAIVLGTEIETDRIAYYANFEKPIIHKLKNDTLFEMDLVAGVKRYDNDITAIESIGINDGRLYYDPIGTVGNLKIQVKFGRIK